MIRFIYDPEQDAFLDTDSGKVYRAAPLAEDPFGQPWGDTPRFGLRDLIPPTAREWVANPNGDGLIPKDQLDCACEGKGGEPTIDDLYERAWDLLDLARDLKLRS